MKINLGTLANLDPGVVRTTASADDPQLADILASDRSTPVPGLPRRRRRTSWVVAGAATLAVAMAIFGFSQVGAVAPQAFADWTPQPGEATPQQKQQLYDDCASLIQDRVVINSLGQSISSRGATSVIVDQRGSYHAMLVGSPTMWGLCSNLTGTGVLSGEIQANYTDPDWVVPPDDITFIAGRGNPVFGPDGPNLPMPSTDGNSPYFELIAGRAGANVVAIQAVTNLGQTIDASLSDGFWLVYGPIDRAKEVADATRWGLLEYIVTLSDGRTVHVNNENDNWSECFAPAPHVPDGYACLPPNIYIQTAAPFDVDGQTPREPITAPPSPLYAAPSDEPTSQVRGIVVPASTDGTEQAVVLPVSSDNDVVAVYSSDGTVIYRVGVDPTDPMPS